MTGKIALYLLSSLIVASMWTVASWLSMRENERNVQGITLGDILRSCGIGILPGFNIIAFVIAAGIFISYAIDRADNVTLFKSKKRYSQEEVDELLKSIERMKKYPLDKNNQTGTVKNNATVPSQIFKEEIPYIGDTIIALYNRYN